MTEKQHPSKLGRILALILMGLTVFFTLVGGGGTTCVAFGAENYDGMEGLIPFKPLYQILVVLSIAAGIWGIPVMVSLVRGGDKAYRNAMIVLIAGAVTSGIQTAVSQSVRGSSAPANIRFAVTLFTLIVFLIFRIPSIWRRMMFDHSLKGDPAKTAGGAAFAVTGLMTLSAPLWVAQTHMEPWISGIRTPLMIVGLTLTLAGVALLTTETWLPWTHKMTPTKRSIAVQ